MNAREQAWEEYRAKMLELDAANNLAGRGLIPSWRDWHAGWDARDAATLSARLEAARLKAEELAPAGIVGDPLEGTFGQPLDLAPIRARIEGCGASNFVMRDQLAREDAPALVAEVVRLRATIAEIRLTVDPDENEGVEQYLIVKDVRRILATLENEATS